MSLCCLRQGTSRGGRRKHSETEAQERSEPRACLADAKTRPPGGVPFRKEGQPKDGTGITGKQRDFITDFGIETSLFLKKKILGNTTGGESSWKTLKTDGKL